MTEPYRHGTIPRGKASDLLGMPLDDFLRYAGKPGIPYVDLTEDVWEAEKRAVWEIPASLPPSAARVG